MVELLGIVWKSRITTKCKGKVELPRNVKNGGITKNCMEKRITTKCKEKSNYHYM